MGSIEFNVATAADDPDLRYLLRGNPMPGEIAVSLECEPDSFAARAISGDPHHTIIARDLGTRRPVGMGSRAVYNGFLNGEPRRIGYLSQLRIDRAYRGRIRLLREGYRLIRSLRGVGDLPFDLTTIVADNRPALRVLASRLGDLPTYLELEPFITVIVPLWRRRRARRGREFRIERGSIEKVPSIAQCLDRNRARFQFAPRWTVCEFLSPARSRGLAPNDFLVATVGDNVIGCVALWDQSSFKQIVVHSYGPAMRRWRPFVDLVSRVAGTPRLPAPGRPIPHVFLSHVAVDEDRSDVFNALFSAACNEARARGHTYLVTGFAERHPFLGVLRRAGRAWTYASIIYAVCWEGERAAASGIDRRTPHLEVGLL